MIITCNNSTKIDIFSKFCQAMTMLINEKIQSKIKGKISMEFMNKSDENYRMEGVFFVINVVASLYYCLYNVK